MGEAKRRGTFDERKAQAQPKERKIGAEERRRLMHGAMMEVMGGVMQRTTRALTGKTLAARQVAEATGKEVHVVPYDEERMKKYVKRMRLSPGMIILEDKDSVMEKAK